MLRPPGTLKTISQKREWLEKVLPISEDILKSSAYRALTDEAKIILMLMLDKQRGEKHESTR